MSGEKSNMGKGAPAVVSGIVNAVAGKHAYSEKGKTDSGKPVSGYGPTPDKATADYQKKGGK
ncbi:MAG: hypothetical protein Q7U88_02685 [Desulfocapsaceae bacterium]|nr:hypothetical protein [Desulfocapsaceae bacterium]